MTNKLKATAKSETTSNARASRNLKAASKSNPTAPAQTTKRNQLVALLVRDGGATIKEMIDATGWLPHTVRAALTGLKKLGYEIDSDKIEGLRTYRAVAPK